MGGQAHREPKDRILEVNRYYSYPKSNVFRRLLGKPEVGVDEWIGLVAGEKDRLNEEVRKTVRSQRPKNKEKN